jgi:hypothetical protein
MKCLTYSQLLTMKRNADWAWDMYWDLKMYDQCLRYTRISQRILEAMTRMPIENVLLSDRG